jgi:hypothetical protein
VANNIVDISGAIARKLRGVSGLQVVYEYEPDKPADGSYPFATVTPQDFSASFGDTVRNIRTYTMVIRVYQERIEAAFGNEKAERLIREMSDEITTAFDMDTTLSGMVKWVKPARGDLSYVERETGDQRVAEFILECTTVVPSIT